MKKLAIILILIGIGINLHSQSDTVIFSASGGFYENSFDLTLTCNNPNNKIYYTTNGNVITFDQKTKRASAIETIRVREPLPPENAAG